MAGEMGQLAETAIGQAIMRGCVKEVRTLIEDGENPRFMDRKGNTYLHFVSTTFRPYVFHVIAASGLEINAQNRDGNTALHVTALNNECCHVTDLLAAGVEPFIRNKVGKTAADIAHNNRFWLDLYGKYEPGLRNAIKERNMDQIKYHMHDAWSAVHISTLGKDVRQYAAALTHHDIVAMLDKARFTLMAVYAVLERNYTDLTYALSRGTECDVNCLQLLHGSHPHHILQHAIRQSEHKMVKMLIKAGADVNTTVYVKEYFRGPLYFEAISFVTDFDERIRKSVLNAGIDLSARDERGRSALMYAIDRRNGDVTMEVVQFLLDSGINIAASDETGCTARDVALFARRADIIKVIDKHVVNMIKNSEIPAIRSLAMQQYERVQLDFNYRDTWMYAQGNESQEMTTFLETLPAYKLLVKNLFLAITEGDLKVVQTVVADCHDAPMLLRAKDKFGRGTLLKAVMHERYDVTSWLLEEDPALVNWDVDNTGRTPLHYAWSILSPDDRSQFVSLLEEHGASVESRDLRTYALELEIYCLEKYEKLLKVIRSKRKGLKEFDAILKDLRYPVSNFTALFHPEGNPLVSNFRDLLLAAIDHDKEDLARRLVRCGVDCSWTQHYTSGDICLRAEERASLLGQHQLAEYIRLKGKYTQTIPG